MFKSILAGVVAVIALVGFLSSFTTIETQEKGVVTRFGAINRTLDEGFHLVNPFTENVTKMDISVQKLTLQELAYSQDSQIVGATVVVNYRIVPGEVSKIFQDVKQDYESKYVVPEARDAVKSIIAGYTAQGIVEKRAEIPLKIQERLQEELANKSILVTNVAVENFDFDDQYEAAVQNKQVQEQEKFTQINITAQEEEKKKQEILKAQALAEKTRLEAVALESQNGEKVIEKIYAEAALEAAKKWNGVSPTTVVTGSADGNLPLFPYMSVNSK